MQSPARLMQPIASTSKCVLRGAPLLSSRGLASHAYVPPVDRPSSSTPSAVQSAATTSTPSHLTPAQRQLLERTIRVDQAGELGANWIYRGQKLVATLRGDKRTAQQIEEMWETERHHLRTMDKLQAQHRVRPTALYPVWKGAAMGLGVVTALMGKKALMACTEAVETVIGEHYDDQIKELDKMIPRAADASSGPTSPTASSADADAITSTSPSSPAIHPSLPLLHSILSEFRDDELEHLDTAVENGAQMAPAHALLSTVIETGCRGAIWLAARV